MCQFDMVIRLFYTLGYKVTYTHPPATDVQKTATMKPNIMLEYIAIGYSSSNLANKNYSCVEAIVAFYPTSLTKYSPFRLTVVYAQTNVTESK